jgi:hypothetical protein
MPVIVVLGGPILSLVDAVIVQPPYGLAHRTIGGHGREVSNLDFEAKNPDLTEGRRSRAEATRITHRCAQIDGSCAGGEASPIR